MSEQALYLFVELQLANKLTDYTLKQVLQLNVFSFGDVPVMLSQTE